MDFELLKRIVQAPGAPGFEQPVRQLIIDEVGKHVDDYSVDGIGNLIVRIKGDGPRVMASAHMDEISLISTQVDENGFVRFSTLGGFDPITLTTQRVLVHGKEDLVGVIGSKPIHVQTDEEKKQPPKLSNLFIDVGLPADKVRELVPDGTPITRQRELIKMGDCITGKSLDNRISVFILIEAIKQASSSRADFYGVFSVQEEVGIRGARVAANGIQPGVGIALDTTLANDLPSIGKHEYCTRLGEGPAVKVMDKSVISSPDLVRFLSTLAERHGINYQREVLTAGGTDTSGMQYLMGLGTKVCCISTPTRYIHSTVETVSQQDVEGAIEWTRHMIEEIHQYTPGHE